MKKNIELLIKMEDSTIKNTSIQKFVAEKLGTQRGIHLDREKKTVGVLCKKDDAEALSDFYEVILFLKFLEENHTAIIHSNHHQEGNFTSKDIKSNELESGKYVMHSIPTDLYYLVDRYLRGFIYISKELRSEISDETH